jgi:eukaryotic-like serine/threonine-protein kinase
MSIRSVPELVAALQEYQLLDPALLEEAQRELIKEDTNLLDLAGQLVERQWLTAYQVDRLMQGRGQDLLVGSYRLIEPIGEGGMGQVFKALHQRLNRVVALKLIRPECLSQDPEAVKRFQREARAAAQLTHPNVVIVYDAAQVDGNYFIAMEYVEGTDLARLVRESGPLPVPDACDYIRQAALGLQHAFECGMVHRDIKPSNLLLTVASLRGSAMGLSGGGAFAAGPNAPGQKPRNLIKILDLGLARLAQSSDPGASFSTLTRDGSVIGTPDYISPEQARNAHRVDIRADLYSLGCTLYYLLTGLAPFPTGSVVEKLLMHQKEQPRPAEELRPGIPADVLAILRKMMAKRPDERYPGPLEVVQALTKLRPPEPPPTRSRPAPLQTAPKPAPRPARPGTVPTPVMTEIQPVAGPQAPKKIATLPGHRGAVMALTFSPSRNLLVTGGVDGRLRAWNFNERKPKDRTAPRLHQGEVHSLAFAPDNQLLASGSGGVDGVIWLWDVTADGFSERTSLCKQRAAVEALAFSPDGKFLASAASDRTIWLWDLSGPKPRERGMLKGHTDVPCALDFAPDGRHLASSGLDGTVRLWGGAIWFREQAVLQGHHGQVRSVSFSPDGKLLASAGTDRTVRIWDVAAFPPTLRLVLEGHSSAVRRVVFPPGGPTVVSVEDRCRVIVWDALSGARQDEWGLPETVVCSTAFTFDGRYLALGNPDGKVFIYRLGSKR